jgi:signal transduction histidine kinase
MSKVLGCVFDQHDLRLVFLAGLLCLFACTSAMSMIRRARAVGKPAKYVWLLASGVVAGTGIWGTHFVAMLAYRQGFPVSYDLHLTVLSAVIAMTLCAAGFWISLSGVRPAIGGAVTGAAIGTMHYVGMAAVRAPAEAFWDWRYVAASVIVGIIMTAAGMDIAIRRGTRAAFGAGAIAFTLAICSMHFTGMTAVEYRFNPTVLVSNAVVEPGTLAIAVAAVAVLIVALGLIGALIDSHLTRRTEGEAERLRAHIVELEATQDALEKTSHDLSLALDAAAAANLAKSSFLAAMSHELRTPLNAIIGFAEILAVELLGPLGHKRYREYAADIRGSGIHLLALINDILDISRIDAGDTRLEEESIDLQQLIAQTLRMIGPQAAAARVVLESELSPVLPVIRGDKRRLRQVLINLLANAVKFTPAKGRIVIRAGYRGGAVTIAVQDTGIGIAEQDIPRALERFGQVDARLSRKYEGVGLGLPLAKKFVELHGGTLTLDSAPKIGTTVTVTLPASRIVDEERFAAAAAMA